MEPAFGDDRNVVVRRDGFEHRNSESDVVLNFCVSLAEDEGVGVQDNFTINIFDQDDEALCATVDLLVPTEVRGDRKIYP